MATAKDRLIHHALTLAAADEQIGIFQREVESCEWFAPSENDTGFAGVPECWRDAELTEKCPACDRNIPRFAQIRSMRRRAYNARLGIRRAAASL